MPAMSWHGLGVVVVLGPTDGLDEAVVPSYTFPTALVSDSAPTNPKLETRLTNCIKPVYIIHMINTHNKSLIT